MEASMISAVQKPGEALKAKEDDGPQESTGGFVDAEDFCRTEVWAFTGAHEAFGALKGSSLTSKGSLSRRYDLFPLFDEGIECDDEMLFSVTPDSLARHVAERCSCPLLLDGFAGAFLAPPWGGPSYAAARVMNIRRLGSDIDFYSAVRLARRVAPRACAFLPRSCAMKHLLEAASIFAFSEGEADATKDARLRLPMTVEGVLNRMRFSKLSKLFRLEALLPSSDCTSGSLFLKKLHQLRLETNQFASSGQSVQAAQDSWQKWLVSLKTQKEKAFSEAVEGDSCAEEQSSNESSEAVFRKVQRWEDSETAALLSLVQTKQKSSIATEENTDSEESLLPLDFLLAASTLTQGAFPASPFKAIDSIARLFPETPKEGGEEQEKENSEETDTNDVALAFEKAASLLRPPFACEVAEEDDASGLALRMPCTCGTFGSWGWQMLGCSVFLGKFRSPPSAFKKGAPERKGSWQKLPSKQSLKPSCQTPLKEALRDLAASALHFAGLERTGEHHVDLARLEATAWKLANEAGIVSAGKSFIFASASVPVKVAVQQSAKKMQTTANYGTALLALERRHAPSEETPDSTPAEEASSQETEKQSSTKRSLASESGGSSTPRKKHRRGNTSSQNSVLETAAAADEEATGGLSSSKAESPATAKDELWRELLWRNFEEGLVDRAAEALGRSAVFCACKNCVSKTSAKKQLPSEAVLSGSSTAHSQNYENCLFQRRVKDVVGAFIHSVFAAAAGTSVLLIPGAGLSKKLRKRLNRKQPQGDKEATDASPSNNGRSFVPSMAAGPRGAFFNKLLVAFSQQCDLGGCSEKTEKGAEKQEQGKTHEEGLEDDRIDDEAKWTETEKLIWRISCSLCCNTALLVAIRKSLHSVYAAL